MRARRTGGRGFASSHGSGKFGSLSLTLGAGSVTQLLSALAGFVTLPILIHALGPALFGVLVVVVSLAPWLTVIDGALYPVTRLLVGESRRGEQYTAPRRLLQRAFRMTVVIAVFNLVVMLLGVFLLPLVDLFGAEGVADHGQLVLAILLFSLPIILCGPGGVYLGALEGVGRTVIATIFLGLGPIVALPLTLLVAWRGGDLVWLCAVQGLAVAVPGLCAWIYWRLRPSLRDPETDQDDGRIRLRLVGQVAMLSAAVLIQSGLDPVIVSSQLGADPAGAFGLANRLVTGALIPLAVLSPLFAGNLAAARAGGWTREEDVRLRTLFFQAAAVGALIGGCVLVLGPPVGAFLSGGDVQTPLSLYAAGAVFVFGTFAAAPLYLAFSGPSGLARSVRLNAVLVVANVGLSLVLVRVVGASGPLWASAAAAVAAVLFWLAMWRRHPEWLDEAHPVGERAR